MSYYAVHKRIRQMLGSASNRPCAQCGNRAHEWAYDHKDPRAITGVWHGRAVTYSVNPVHYQPLCRSCHRRRDGNGRKPLYPKRNGSSRHWRGLRESAAREAGYRCQLRKPVWCIDRAPLHAEPGTPAGHLHHTLGRGVTGNDPRFLAWACAPCNLHTSDPAQTPDPAPIPRTRW